MKIEEIKVKNFRSVGPTGVVIHPKMGLNVLVGENSVGKSVIATAIALACQAPRGEPTDFEPSDYHNGKVDIPIEVSVVLTLSHPEGEHLCESILGPATSVRGILGDHYDTVTEEFISTFCKRLEVGFIAQYRPHQALSRIIKLGDFLYVGGARARNVKDISGSQVSIMPLIEKYIESDVRTLLEFLDLRFKQQPNIFLTLNADVQHTVAGLLQKSVKWLSEVRSRPVGGTADVLDSPDGRETADVLQKLKNSDDPDLVGRWDSIVETFGKIYRPLRLDSVRVSGKSAIRIIRNGFRIPDDKIAMGVMETIIMLTNMIRPGEYVMTIEEPELHLHPHAQRAMAGFIREWSGQNQLLVITHSPHFVYPDNLSAHILVRSKAGETDVTQIPPDYFTTEEQAKLRMRLEPQGAREIFFSRRALLVEGPFEVGAFTGFGDKLDRNLHQYGISVIPIGGKDNFWLFMKLCQAPDLPYLLILDQDAILEVNRTLDVRGQSVLTSSIFYQLEKIDYLDEDDKGLLAQLVPEIVEAEGGRRRYAASSLDQLRRIAEKYRCQVLPGTCEEVLQQGSCSDLLQAAKREMGDSKFLQGTYVGENISAGQIPQEFVEIIEQLCQV